MGNGCNCLSGEPAAELVVDIKQTRVASSPETVAISFNDTYALDAGTDGVLGLSSMGSVVRTRHRTRGTFHVVKQISKKNILDPSGEVWRDDIQALMHLDHPHICKLHETMEDQRNVYLIMEFCRGGSIVSLRRRQDILSESVVSRLVWQMSSAISHLHKHGLAHSDIRLENWLFGVPEGEATGAGKGVSHLDMSLKMIDFGLASKHCKHGARRRSFCTMSRRGLSSPRSPRRQFLMDPRDLVCKGPEQLAAKSFFVPGEDQSSLQRADVWAIGVLAYFLLSARTPFEGCEDVRNTQIANASYVFMPIETWRPVSSAAKNFIALCLQRVPEHRPSAAQLLELPWMRLARQAMEEHENGDDSKTSRQWRDMQSMSDPPLPLAEPILSAFDHVNLLNKLEKVATVLVAHSLPSHRLPRLTQDFKGADKGDEMCLHMMTFLNILCQHNVPCGELLEGARACGDAGAAVRYHDFVQGVDDLQRSLQDGAAWALFERFDTDSFGRQDVTKKALLKALGKDDVRSRLLASFPALSLDRIMQDLPGRIRCKLEVDQLSQALREIVEADAVLLPTDGSS